MSDQTTASSATVGTFEFSSRSSLTDVVEHAPASCLGDAERIAIEEMQETDALLYENYNFPLWGDDLKVIGPIGIVSHGDLDMLPPVDSVTSELCRVSLCHGLQEEGISRNAQLKNGNDDTIPLDPSKVFSFHDHYTCSAAQNSCSLDQSINLVYQERQTGFERSDDGNMNVDKLDNYVTKTSDHACSGEESFHVEESTTRRSDNGNLGFHNENRTQTCDTKDSDCGTCNGEEPENTNMVKDETELSSGMYDNHNLNHVNVARMEVHDSKEACIEEPITHEEKTSLNCKVGRITIVNGDCGGLNLVDVNRKCDSVMEFVNTSICVEPGCSKDDQDHKQAQKCCKKCDHSDDCFSVNKVVKILDHNATDSTKLVNEDNKTSNVNDVSNATRDWGVKAPDHGHCNHTDSGFLEDEKSLPNQHSQVSLRAGCLTCLHVENSVTERQQMINGDSLNTVKNGEDSSALVEEDDPNDDEEEETEESQSEEESSSSSLSSSSEDSDSSSEEGDKDSSMRPVDHSKGNEMEVDSDFEEGELKESPSRLNKRGKSVKRKDDFFVDDSSDDECLQKEPIHSKYEKSLPPVPKVSVILEAHHKTVSIGVISSVLGVNLIVEGIEGQPPLNEGSILWLTEKRLPLGIIDELFGPVKKPFYLVRYNAPEEIPEGAQEGVPVAFVPEFADFALNNPDIYSKGYDDLDGDVSDSEVEFSDDEKEAEYRRSRTNTKREREKTDNENQVPDRRLQGHHHRRGSRMRDNQKESFGWATRNEYQQSQCDNMQSPKIRGNQQNGYHDYSGRQPRKQHHHSPGESKQSPNAHPNQRPHDSNGAGGRKPYQGYAGKNSEAKDSSGMPIRRLYQSHPDENKKKNEDFNKGPSRISHQAPKGENIQKPTAAAEPMPAHQSQFQTVGTSHQALEPSRMSLCSNISSLNQQDTRVIEVNETHNVPINSFPPQVLTHLPLQSQLQAPRPVATGYGVPVGGPMLQSGIPVVNNPLPHQSGVPVVNLLHHQSGVSVASQRSHQSNTEGVQGWPTSLHQTGMFGYPESHSSFSSNQQPSGIATQVFGLPPQAQIQAVAGYSVGVQAHVFGTPVIGVPARPESFCHIAQGAGNQSFLPLASNSSTGFHPGSSSWGSQDMLPQSYKPCTGPWQQNESPFPPQRQRYAPRDRSQFQNNKQNGQYNGRRF